MTHREMWDAFTREAGVQSDYVAWAFGADPDELAELVLRGVKTATSSGYVWYGIDHEPFPEVGSYNVVLDSKEQAVCIVKTTRVYVTTFGEVTPEHAWKEGEGDRGLAYWREVHERFFRKCDEESGLSFFCDKMKVVCEEFLRVYP